MREKGRERLEKFSDKKEKFTQKFVAWSVSFPDVRPGRKVHVLLYFAVTRKVNAETSRRMEEIYVTMVVK